MRKILLFLTISTFILSSCEWLEENIPEELSETEVIEGLKTALAVGADSSSGTLSKINGYYANPLLKIPLPEEAELVRQFVTNNAISSFFDLDQEFENVVMSINRAAEGAAKEAAPIFKDAISSLTIDQGWDILNGIVPGGTKSTTFDSTAATGFLKVQIYSPLTDLYAPKINTALGKDLGLGFSATAAWETLTSKYNSTLSSSAVQTALTLAELSGNPINVPGEMNTDLGIFSTEKALDGLFYKVGDEEKKIRRDPWAWVTTTVGNILTKVFGS